MRVLVDINSILDVLAYRQTFYEDSARVWSAVENRQVEGIIAAHTVTTIYYLTRKQRSR